jgi:hypothetical protein
VSAAGAHYPTTTTTNNKSTSGTWCRKQYRVVRPVTSRRPAMARPQTPPLPDRGGSGASAAGPHGHRRHRRHPRPGGPELDATRTPLRMDCSANAPSARVKSTNNNKCACKARRRPQVDDHRRVITDNKTSPRVPSLLEERSFTSRTSDAQTVQTRVWERPAATDADGEGVDHSTPRGHTADDAKGASQRDFCEVSRLEMRSKPLYPTLSYTTSNMATVIGCSGIAELCRGRTRLCANRLVPKSTDSRQMAKRRRRL